MEKGKKINNLVSDYILKDTEQTKRMKNLSLGRCYTNSGDIYKLLDYKVLHDLVVKIKTGSVKISNTLIYGTEIITKEEKFLENLDNYISFIKDNYFLDSWEILCLIEVSLENKYSEILFCEEDFYDLNIRYKYEKSFKRMFMYNLYSNAYYLEEYVDNYTSIKKFTDKFRNMDIDNDENLEKIDFVFKKIIGKRKNNLFNSFVPYTEYNEKNLYFYAQQVDWVLSEYFDSNSIYNILVDDTKMIVKGKTEFIFKLLPHSKNKEYFDVYSNINNDFINYEKILYLSKKELKLLLKKLKKFIKMDFIDSSFEEEFCFVDADIRFYLYMYDGYKDLDIRFYLRNDILKLDDYYELVLSNEQIIEFEKILEKQL